MREARVSEKMSFWLTRSTKRRIKAILGKQSFSNFIRDLVIAYLDEHEKKQG